MGSSRFRCDPFFARCNLDLLWAVRDEVLEGLQGFNLHVDLLFLDVLGDSIPSSPRKFSLSPSIRLLSVVLISSFFG